VAAYRLLLKPSAASEIDAIGAKADRRRIVARIGKLALQPRPPGGEKLAGADGWHRVRQGDYRIVYAIDDERREVVVVKVGHRREVYR